MPPAWHPKPASSLLLVHPFRPAARSVTAPRGRSCHTCLLLTNLPLPPPCSQKCDGPKGEELAFAAQCNTKVVQGAEKYYRNMWVCSAAAPRALLAGRLLLLLLLPLRLH